MRGYVPENTATPNTQLLWETGGWNHGRCYYNTHQSLSCLFFHQTQKTRNNINNNNNNNKGNSCYTRFRYPRFYLSIMSINILSAGKF
jgi:hypothetical protein